MPDMTKSKQQVAATIGGSAEDVEAVFYEALQNADIEKMMSCWADDDEIVCIHPGGPRIIGLASIRGAFEALFSNGSVQAYPERVVKLNSLTSAVHSVVERVEVMLPDGPQKAYTSATNVYQHTPMGWKMVVHHASPGTPQEVKDVSLSSQVLH
jgi:ketosteroid isomerase-like protein